MNLLFVSNSELNSFTNICYCVLAMPKHVKWKILGNREFHKELISLFGQDRFVHIPILKLKEHIQDEHIPFEFLATLSEKHIIIPTDFQSLKFISKNKKNFKGHIVCRLMDSSWLLYLDDKKNMKKVAEDCGVRSPLEYSFTKSSKLPSGHRLVVKPHLGDGSSGVFISEDKEQAVDYYEQLTPENKQKHIIQDFIEGRDFYYYGICYEGKILVSSIIVPGRFKHFGTYFTENASVDENAKKIVAHYKYSGPISIDYRIDKKSKEVYLIEINPRNGNNSYLFNVAHSNWLFELAKISENPATYTHTHKITINKWVCIFKLGMLYCFNKLKLYKVWGKFV